MNKYLSLIAILLTCLFSSCSDIDTSIDEDYEKAEITSIVLYNRAGKVVSDKVTINSDEGYISVTLKSGADIKDLKMTATISSGATMSPSLSRGFQDYSSPYSCKVTSPGESIVKAWTITVLPPE